MKVAVIPADPAQEIQIKDIEGTLEEYQKLVGGYIEGVSVQFHVAGGLRGRFYVDEEGSPLIKNKPLNHRATVLAQAGRGISQSHGLYGDAVLFGGIDTWGDDLPITDQLIQLAKSVAFTDEAAQS